MRLILRTIQWKDLKIAIVLGLLYDKNRNENAATVNC